MDSFSRYRFILNVSNTAVSSSQLTNPPLQLPLVILTDIRICLLSEDDIKPYRKSSNS